MSIAKRLTCNFGLKNTHIYAITRHCCFNAGKQIGTQDFNKCVAVVYCIIYFVVEFMSWPMRMYMDEEIKIDRIIIIMVDNDVWCNEHVCYYRTHYIYVLAFEINWLGVVGFGVTLVFFEWKNHHHETIILASFNYIYCAVTNKNKTLTSRM